LELVVTELLEKLAIRRFSDTDRPLESFNEFMRDAKTRVGEKLYPNNPQSRRR